MKYEKLIRLSPKILVLAALLDFLKQLPGLLLVWRQYHQEGPSWADYAHTNGLYALEFYNQLLGLFLYPFGWLVSAIIITLLLNLYDLRRSSPPEAPQ